ncbi:MAG: serine/threonine-protein phosphatase [Spirulina sp. DLM2.Bin59]|nr:MAG: serine/threonine-protein phosphatase [Spirulina sp. DLM2.Bin59]
MTRSPLSPHPFLWAAGPIAAKLTSPNVVEGRYKVLYPHVWQDIYPEQIPNLPDPIPPSVLPYLKLSGLRLHLPTVYGMCQVGGQPVLLLSHGAIDHRGQRLPTLEQAWAGATPLRQAYWFWQALQLWPALAAEGVTASLTMLDRVCGAGGILRLQEIIPRGATLGDFAEAWGPLAQRADGAIAPPLANIIEILRQPNPSLTVAQKLLNQVLLEQAAQLPLSVQVASGTDPGAPDRLNEDHHYPQGAERQRQGQEHLMLVCDGIGGHDGGAIASQMAVQSLRLQVQALLQEIVEDPEIMEPEVVADQLMALIRIANNVICARNDEQQRSARQRMATTLVLALQLPQQIDTPELRGESHELYIAHVGDSRAYWITAAACQCLTVDDDIAGREVRLGRSLPAAAWQRADAGALTQALGTRRGDRITPTVQRFLIEEDGILLLCSDGLSDRHLIERCWQDFAPAVLQGNMSLTDAVQALVQLGRQRNGHDNVTAVAARYSIAEQALAAAPAPQIADRPAAVEPPAITIPEEFEAPNFADPLPESNGNLPLDFEDIDSFQNFDLEDFTTDEPDFTPPATEVEHPPRVADFEPAADSRPPNPSAPPSHPPEPAATEARPPLREPVIWGESDVVMGAEEEQDDFSDFPAASRPLAPEPDQPIDPNLEVSAAFFEDVEEEDLFPAGLPVERRQTFSYVALGMGAIALVLLVVVIFQGQVRQREAPEEESRPILAPPTELPEPEPQLPPPVEE